MSKSKCPQVLKYQCTKSPELSIVALSDELMKYNIITDAEITSAKDLLKLKILVEANKLDKPSCSETAEIWVWTAGQ